MSVEYPIFKSPQMKIPRRGWNFSVDGYKLERDSFGELVEAVTKYLRSKGRSTESVERDITVHTCEENPWMCHWSPSEEKRPTEAARPVKTLSGFREWLDSAIIEYVDSIEAKKRIHMCERCPLNAGSEVMGTADRLIWSRHSPHIKMKQCTHHKHDNAVAVWIKNLPTPNGKPEVKCWANEL